MRSKLIAIIVVLLYSFLNQKTIAQTYHFSNLSTENGLSQSQILSVFQDEDGIMWFGTNGAGIIKHDGKSFEYITDKDGLPDNFVFCITKDRSGKILIGTSNGLAIYDAKAKKGKRFKNYTTKNGLGNNLIFSIVFDRYGSALLGTSKGVSKLTDTTCSALKIDKKLDTSSVFHLLYDSKENLWCSTLGNGVFNYTGTEAKNYTTQNGLQNNMVFGVLEKSENVYWILTGEGLSEFNYEKIRPINPPKISSTVSYYTYFKDKRNALWIGTSGGLLKCTGENDFQVFKKENGLVDNSIWKIMQDRESNLWFTSDQNGISKLSSERFYCLTTKDGLLQDQIKRVYQDKAGNYCIGSKIGLTLFGNNKITNFKNTDLKGSADINTIVQDRDGNYLIGTSNGLLIYNGKTFRRIVCKDAASQYNSIYNILCDSDNTIWLGTPVGVAKMENGYIEPVKNISITKNYIFIIFQDKSKNLWFGTEDGLYKFDGLNVKHFTEKDGFTQKRVTSIIADKENNLWFATHAGLFYLKGDSFINFSDKQGLATNEVMSVIQDNNGFMWAGYSTGLDKITVNNNTIKVKHFGIEDGFLGQDCSANCMIINTKGELVVGTSKGLMFYQKQYDKENNLAPITKLTSIDLFFQKTDWLQYSDSCSTNNIPINLELSYDKNYLTFNFIGVSLTTPQKVNYKYMVKGIDKDWRFSDKTDVSYSNIPPGKYEFILYANNGEGVWNANPIIFPFKIKPPFWRTWWFYSIILLIIAIGFYSYFKIKNSNKKILKQNEIIAEKNGALQNANKEIAEKNQNITDSINYAKRIQQNFLTSEKNLNNVLNEHFILFKPRDIVSGDFYLAFDLEDRITIVCADCTGHGIPGAFMSLIAISLLNEISRSKTILSTSQILEELRERIINALNSERNESGGKDGMDISILSIFKQKANDENINIDFSGANSSMYIVSNKENKIHMEQYTGDKQPVGYYSNMKPFTKINVSAKKGDIIYLFTDGYADQFGGKNGKKLMSKQLKQQILLAYNLPLNEQKLYLDTTFLNWQGKLEQVDDVTVIGIKLS